MRRVWLASYPKSGNTWFRMLLANLEATDGNAADINDLPERGGIASARAPFDHLSLFDSGLLTADEIDRIRPSIYAELARGEQDDEHDVAPETPQLVFVKAHDAYTLAPGGLPLLAGALGADGAVVIVRDPRDVAPSLANHMNVDIDRAIAFMDDPSAAFCAKSGRLHNQLRQQLPTWSGHIATWLEQTDISVHLVRYEDLQRDTFNTLRAALEFAGRSEPDDRIKSAVALASFAMLRGQEDSKGFRESPRWTDNARFFRRGEAGAWREELTPEQVARIERAHAPMMRRLGYELSEETGVTPAQMGCVA